MTTLQFTHGAVEGHSDEHQKEENGPEVRQGQTGQGFWVGDKGQTRTQRQENNVMGGNVDVPYIRITGKYGKYGKYYLGFDN